MPPATTEIYTLSLHDALPISSRNGADQLPGRRPLGAIGGIEGVCGIEESPRHIVGRPAFTPIAEAIGLRLGRLHRQRSEEHTSELQSLTNLVCRLLLEKKKKK